MEALFLTVFIAVLSVCLLADTLVANRHRRLQHLLQTLQDERAARAHGERMSLALRRGAAGALRRALDRIARSVRLTAAAEGADRLRWAGWSLRGDQLAALQLLLAGAGAVALLALGGGVLGGGVALPLGLLGALAGYAAPDVWLKAAIRHRHEAIDRELLYFLDFLALAGEAGLSIDAAIAEVAAELPGILSTAFAQVQAERGMGQWNEHALAGAADRLGHRDVRTVVDALVRAGRFGARTATVLRELSLSIRRRRDLAAREHANRVGAAIVLPVAVFILPSIVLLLGYPALRLVTGALGAP